MPRHLTRRDAIANALGIAATLSLIAAPKAAAQTGDQSMTEADIARHRHDWDWLVGNWNVRHRRLKARLAGNTEWEEFAGTSKLWLTLDGLGTVDDNFLELPSGAYRAMGVRAFDMSTGLWSIWWIDGRSTQAIDPPVRGGFADGVGTFEGDDTLNGRPIRVRYQWSNITANTAHWEQAFSPDGGESWEVNWRMDFTRAAD